MVAGSAERFWQQGPQIELRENLAGKLHWTRRRKLALYLAGLQSKTPSRRHVKLWQAGNSCSLSPKTPKLRFSALNPRNKYLHIPTYIYIHIYIYISSFSIWYPPPPPELSTSFGVNPVYSASDPVPPHLQMLEHMPARVLRAMGAILLHPEL